MAILPAVVAELVRASIKLYPYSKVEGSNPGVAVYLFRVIELNIRERSGKIELIRDLFRERIQLDFR